MTNRDIIKRIFWREKFGYQNVTYNAEIKILDI